MKSLHNFMVIKYRTIMLNKSLFISLSQPTQQQDIVATSSQCQWRPSDVAGTSQMKHPTMSHYNASKTSQWYVFTAPYWYVVTTSHRNVITTSHQYVSTTSETSLKWNPQRRLSGTSPRRLSGTYPQNPISTSLWHLL